MYLILCPVSENILLKNPNLTADLKMYIVDPETICQNIILIKQLRNF